MNRVLRLRTKKNGLFEDLLHIEPALQRKRFLRSAGKVTILHKCAKCTASDQTSGNTENNGISRSADVNRDI
jgi:hypothetical protein